MKPLVLDLFCGSGGASMGYYRAGFDPIGVDIVQQPDYPFPFIWADAMTVIRALLTSKFKFDLIHASPPCQAYTKYGKAMITTDGRQYPNLLQKTIVDLDNTGTPYVVENVPFAPLRPDLKLYGYMFNLKVIRERWFQLGNGLFIMNPIKPEKKGSLKEGDFVTVAGNGSASVRSGREYHGKPKFWQGNIMATWSKAMGIDWMNTYKGLAEAIPPAYTEYIGKNIYEQIVPAKR